ncbi:hypothetical protein NQ318_002461, partial [Aromia moschata]
RLLLLCFLFSPSHGYYPRQYYQPWLESTNYSPTWERVSTVRGEQQRRNRRGRHFRPETIHRITETLGALNTVGRYLVNMTRGTDSNSNRISPDVPMALYTISKNVLGRNVTDTIAPLVKEALPVPIEEKEESVNVPHYKKTMLKLRRLMTMVVRILGVAPPGRPGRGVCCPRSASASAIGATTSTAATTTTIRPVTFAAIFYNTEKTTTKRPSLVSSSTIVKPITNVPNISNAVPGVLGNFVDPQG